MNATQTDPLLWGKEIKLFDGTRHEDNATRQEFITMLHRLHNLRTASKVSNEAVEKPLSFIDNELDILYRIAWAEARGEDDKGLILVINVIMNRVNSSAFPNQNTVKDVVFAPNQFSPITNGSFDRATPDNRIKSAVHRALQGEDYSRGATFFRSVRNAEGSWHERTLNRIFTHGNHHFYTPRR